jgi:hypothetical protein
MSWNSTRFLSVVPPLPEGTDFSPSVVIGEGGHRHLFSLGPGAQPGGFIVAVDTIYGSARMFCDEMATAILYHQHLAVIGKDRKVHEVEFHGTVFDIVENGGEHILEMELGCALLGRGFSPVLWCHEVPDIVTETRFVGDTIEMGLFEGGRVVIRAADGSGVSYDDGRSA